jgi:hypothetical protein
MSISVLGSRDTVLAYGVEDVPAKTGIGRTSVFRAIRDGELRARKMGRCESAWNKDPVFGVIGIQSGPRG